MQKDFISVYDSIMGLDSQAIPPKFNVNKIILPLKCAKFYHLALKMCQDSSKEGLDDLIHRK